MSRHAFVVLSLLLLAGCENSGSDEPNRSAQSHALTEKPAALSELRALLRAPDVILDADRLAAWGSPEQLVTAFDALLNDSTCSTYERTRVLSALRFIDEPRVAPLLRGVITDPDRSDFERRVAIKSYGLVEGERALETLEELADHSDRHTREAVLRALIGIDTPESRAVLKRRASVESEPDLRQLATRGTGS